MTQKRNTPDPGFRRLPFVYLLIPFIGGILFRHWLPEALPLHTAIGTLIIVSILTGILFSLKNRISKNSQSILLFYALLLCGYIICLQNDITRNKNWFGSDLQSVTALSAKVIAPPQRKSRTILINLAVEKVRRDNAWQKTTGRLQLYVFLQDSIPEINVGDQLIMPNKLVAISNRGNPFEFDYARYLQRQGLYFKAFLPVKDLYVIHDEQRRSHWLEQFRNRLFSAIQNNIADTATMALTEATLLNDRSLLDNQIWRAYSLTGIAHIIAISGMHVSLFFGILLVFLWWLKAPGIRWLKYLLALPLIWLYIVLTNFPPSAVRAAIMFSIIFIGLAFRRDVNPLNLLAVTGFIILCAKPQWLFDAGIQLSFTAVASIFLFFKPIKSYWRPESKLFKALWDLIALSLSVQILVLPIVLYYFHQFPLWFLPANIPAALFSFLLMVMALLLLLLSALGIPCIWLGDTMTFMTHAFHQIIFTLSRYTPRGFRNLYISETAFWLLFAGIITLCLFYTFKKRLFCFLSLGAFALFFAGQAYTTIETLKQDRIVVYNCARYSIIDHFKGKNCYPVGETDSNALPNLDQYVLLPARLGFHAIRVSNKKSSAAIVKIKGKRVLILPAHLDLSGRDSFSVNFLIVSHQCSFQPEQWQAVFHPQKIILDSSLPRYKARRWRQKLATLGLMVHNVQEDGAWIFPEAFQ
ncbi:MAG TPA: ComEC/Rec2 family competence protein [Edaphocola sp.]|nr:ComEC/Rec2 family competence protein [Edaphocola sp.]